MPIVKRVKTQNVQPYFWRKDVYSPSGQKTWYPKVLSSSKSVTSLFPDTRYQPGSFKLRDVLLQKALSTYGVVKSYVYVGRPAYRVDFEHNLVGDIFRPSLPVPAWTSSLDDMLVRNAARKAREDSVGLSETLRESGKTIWMLCKPFDGMRKLLVNKVLHNRMGKRRTASAASAAWLEYRYGWMPLYYTAKALWEFEPLKTQLAKKGSKELFVSDAAARRIVLEITTPVALSHLCDVVVRREDTFRGQYHYFINELEMYNAVQRGTSIFNLPAYMWELTTLSFAIDWWYDVGGLIRHLMPAPYVQTLGMTTSRKVVFSRTVTPTHTSPSGGKGPYTPGGPDSSFVDETYQRKIYTRNLTPPKLDLGFNSWKHAVDALSLITQRLL